MPDQQARVFISYSRRDSDFAKRVVNELGRHGRDIWVDWEDINVAEDWLQAVYDGIEKTDTFLFITTRHSVMSEVCNLEIQHARLHNKRIIPIVRERIEGGLRDEVEAYWKSTQWTEMGQQNWTTLGHLNWLFFDNDTRFYAQLESLVQTIDTDLTHVKTHTRLLVRAREWEVNAESTSFLANGEELLSAETWLKDADEYHKYPPATDLHREYITASREVEDATNARIRRLRNTSIFAGVATGLLVLAALVAGVVSFNAVRNSNMASTEVAIANVEIERVQADINSAQTREVNANIQVGIASTQLSEANAQVDSANATLEPIQNTLTPVIISLTDSALDQATANAQIVQSNTEVAVANINAMTATVQLATADAQVSQADDQIATAEAQLIVAQEQIATADIQVTAAQNQLATAAAQGTQAQNEIIDANTQLNAAQNQIATADVQVTQAQAQIDAANVQVTQAGEQVATADAQIVIAEAQIEDANIQVTAAQNQVATADVQVTQAQADLAEANVALTQVAPALTQASDTILSANTQVAEANVQVTDVQAQINTASTQSAIIQADAEISRRQANSQALIFSAEQAIATGELDLALPLLLRSYDINPNLAQTQRLLNDIAYTTARFIVDSPFVVFNDDSSAIAYAEDTVIIVQDIITRAEIARLDGHSDTVTVADFSGDGRYFLSGSADSTVIVWDTDTWAIVATLEGHTQGILDAEFDANSTRVAAIAGDDRVLVWQVNNSFAPREIPVNPGTQLDRVAFFGDGSRLLAWGTDGQQDVVYNVNIASATTTRNFDLIYDALNPGFDGDAVRFALTEDDGQLIRYDVANGAALRFERGIRFGVDTVGARALNSIGNAIATVITDTETNQSRLVVFDAGTREARSDVRFDGSSDMRITALAFSPDGDALVGADGRYLVVWNTATGQLLNRLAGHADDIIDIAYSPDGNYVITTSRDGNRRLWDVAPNDPSVIAQLTTTSLYEGVISNPALSADATEVYFNIGFGLNRLNITTGESSPEIAVFDLAHVFFSDTMPLAISIVSRTNALDMWDMTDNDSRIWDTSLGAPANETMESIGTFSPDSSQIAVVMTNAIRVYDTSRRVTPGSPTLLDRRGLDISAVTFSHDNTTLYATVNAVDGVVTYGVARWDIETGTRTLINIPHVNRINAIDISTDGTQLLTASNDDTIVLFDLVNEQIERRLSGHQGAVNAVQFSREDSVALSAGSDSRLILWDLALGEPVREYVSSGSVVGLDISLDGRIAASTNNSGFVTIWEIQSTDEIAIWIRDNRTIPVLSAEQCGQFQGACD